MKCQEIQERLSAWLDEELDGTARAAVAAHLESCDACRREVAQLAALDALWDGLAVSPPPGLAGKVAARLPGRYRRWWQSLALAASLVLGITLGGALTQNFYPLDTDNGGGAEVATLEDFHDFPQGSLGTVLASYQTDEGNGNGW